MLLYKKNFTASLFRTPTMYQIISESVEFYRKRGRKHLGLLSRNTIVNVKAGILLLQQRALHLT